MNSVERVKALCKERNVSIAKLEKDLRYANGYIGQLRKGVFPDNRLREIADYFNVTPDFLMGISPTSEGWEKAYRKYLSDILPTLNSTDLNDANIDPKKLEDVAEGTIALTFNLACEIADELGFTVDEMVGNDKNQEQNPSLDAQLSGIDFALSGEIHDLTDAEKQDILDYIRFKKSQRGGGNK